MKKESKDTLKIVFSLIIFFSLFAIILYSYSERYSESCMDEIGLEYCNSQSYNNYKNFFDYFGEEDFMCWNEDGDERLGMEINNSNFNFLQKEWDSCLSKERWSLKKLPNLGEKRT